MSCHACPECGHHQDRDPVRFDRLPPAIGMTVMPEWFEVSARCDLCGFSLAIPAFGVAHILAAKKRVDRAFGLPGSVR